MLYDRARHQERNFAMLYGLRGKGINNVSLRCFTDRVKASITHLYDTFNRHQQRIFTMLYRSRKCINNISLRCFIIMYHNAYLRFFNLRVKASLTEGKITFLITSDYYILYLHKVLKNPQRNIPYISPTYVEAQLTNFAKLESGMP